MKSIIGKNDNKMDNNSNSKKNDNFLKINQLQYMPKNFCKNEDTTIIQEDYFIINSSSDIDLLFDKTKNVITSENDPEKSFYLKFFEFIKIIGKHQNSAEFIKELSDHIFISGGTDNKLTIYDSNYNTIKNQKFSDWVYNVNEKDKKGNFIQIIICSNDKTSLNRINLNNYNLYPIKELKEGSSFCILFNKDKILCFKPNYLSPIQFSFSKVINFSNKYFFKTSSKAGIKINNYYYAFTSNKIISGGKDALYFGNILTKEIVYEIKGFSFIYTGNGLSLISSKENKNKLLLCACKKYISGQKNGILLVNIQSEEKIKISYKFYNTNNFEVYCFCPIFVIKKNNNIFEENKIKTKTDYFLVGGFESNKSKGIIKLYKIIYNQNFSKNKIEFIQNVAINNNNNFKGFKGPISSIIQSSKGDIIITSWDKNIYLFKPINIEYFLFYDKKNIKNDKKINIINI